MADLNGKIYFRRVCASWVGEFSRIRGLWAGTCSDPRRRRTNASWLEAAFVTLLLLARAFSLGRIREIPKRRWLRSELSELYVVAWLVALIVLLNTGRHSFLLASVVVWYRFIDALSYRLCILFVDRYEPGWRLRSLNRSLLLLIINYTELIVGFAVLYISSGSIARSCCPTSILVEPMSALYFSAVTAFTLGYGDFTPVDARGQALVTSQLALSFVLVALVISAFLSGVDFIRDQTQKRRGMR